MRGGLNLAGGFGAGWMNRFGPAACGGGHASLQDQVARLLNQAGEAVRAAAHDMGHWARGLLGLGGRRRAIDVQSTITIEAPVESVFAFWTGYPNFGRFMAHVREVSYRGNGCSHWVVAGPLGVTVAWDAVVTRLVPNEALAWESEAGSAVPQSGTARFERTPDGGTRVTVRIAYCPPGGGLGHAFARLFGHDPESAMGEDLMRLKSMIETEQGRLPHAA
jgi:uncharacterized membrane protein